MKLKMVGISLCGSLRGVARFSVNYVICSQSNLKRSVVLTHIWDPYLTRTEVVPALPGEQTLGAK